MRQPQRNSRHCRSGAALLIVLATLVLVLSATTLLVRAASTSQLHRRIDDCTRLADDLLIAAEAPIVDWLATTSASAVIDPDQPAPRIEILHDLWCTGEDDFELAITAWDQLGMVPIESARSGSPLRLALLADTLQELDERDLAPHAIPGLDLFADANPFPSPRPSKPTAFGTGDADGAEAENADHGLHDSPRLGELVATHNREPVRINVNTAPIGLLEAAMRAAHRGGLEQIIRQRRDGKPASVTGTDADHRSERGESVAPQLVSSSNTWSFRIDIRVGPVRRSWWVVYTSSSKNKWEPLQRLAIIH